MSAPRSFVTTSERAARDAASAAHEARVEALFHELSSGAIFAYHELRTHFVRKHAWSRREYDQAAQRLVGAGVAVIFTVATKVLFALSNAEHDGVAERISDEAADYLRRRDGGAS
jgi:hypothetical protein